MAKGFNFRGFLAGMASSATFGMLPLFTVPVMAVGLSVNNILCYRMFIVSIAMAILMLIKRIPFHISLKALGWCMVLGLCYYGSATLLFQGYATMSTGVATTLHFLYPVFVTLIMAFVFKQRTSPFTIVAIILALTGICLLSIGRGGGTGNATAASIVMVLLSGLAYALMCSNVYFIIHAFVIGEGIHAVPTTVAWINLICLALLPTLVSNLALMYSIKSIGSTLTSVLGAMEPLTALIIGVIVFGEQFNRQIGIGVILILIAVTLIILSPIFDKNIAARLERFAKNKADDDLQK